MMIRTPAITITAVIALAIGIGANTAIFTVLNSVLIRSLPHEEADRLVMLFEHSRRHDRRKNVVAPANFLDWQSRARSFSEMAAFVQTTATLSGSGRPEEVKALLVSPDFFRTLRAQPVIGRVFSQSEYIPNSPDAAIISYGLWQRRFGGDTGIVGQAITINARPAVVAGIMPAGFDFAGTEADIWEPLRLDPARDYRATSGRYLHSLARLAPGVSHDAAQREMSALAAALELEHPNFNTGWGVNVLPLREHLSGAVRQPVLILMASVTFVLLIACANVANLLLARSTVRAREIAIRASLGAGRWRVVRQMLTEALLLAAVGGAAGLLIAVWGIDALLRLAPETLFAGQHIRPDLTVFLFSAGVCILTGIVFGLVPALHASRGDLASALRSGGRSVHGGGNRVRNALVIAEVALSVVLLTGAGLMIRSLSTLQSRDPGFDPSNRIAISVAVPNARYPDGDKRVAFFRDALIRIRQTPGVSDVAAAAFLPGSPLISGTRYHIEGQPQAAPGQAPTTQVTAVSPGFFSAMRVPLLEGRMFDERDNSTTAPLRFIVDQSFARAAFPGSTAIGKRISVNMQPENPYGEIIGVVADVRHTGLVENIRPTAYYPHAHLPLNSMYLIVRTNGPVEPLVASVAAAVQSLDPDIPVGEAKLMKDVLNASVARVRFTTMLLAGFSAVALGLAAVGLFGVLSYVAGRRTQEIGVRMALGARRGQVVSLMLRHGAVLAAAGLVVGVAVSFAVTRFLESLLYGVRATDALTFTSATIVIFITALIAAWMPALRASRVDPMTALRYE